MDRLAREGWVEEFGLEEVQREGGLQEIGVEGGLEEVAIPTNARGAGTAVGLRPTRRIGMLGQLHELWQKVKLANFIA